MKPHLSFTLPLLICAVAANYAAAQQAITPVYGGPVGFTEPVNVTPDDQTDPQVSGDLVSYTDFSVTAGEIRYHNFLTGGDASIPTGTIDTLSSTDGTRIAFSRELANRTAIFIFDLATFDQTEVDPQPDSRRFSNAIGGSRVAFVDLNGRNGNGDILVHDLDTHNTRNLSSGLGFNSNRTPRIAPDGNTVVWQSCSNNFLHCGVYAARWGTRGVCPALPCLAEWHVFAVEDTPGAFALNGDTDGSWLVYQSNRPGATDQDIYFKPVVDDGLGERRLAIPGLQFYPTIHQGVVAFVSRQSAASPSDLFIYVIATNRLYQVTSTPLIDDSLSDVTVLPTGEIRVVWAANDEAGGAGNIYAATFTPPRVLAIDSVSAAEGDNGTTALTFTVSLLPAGVGTVQVEYTTADGTATVADGDYAPASGTLTFGLGQTSKTITVNVNGDATPEADETFAVVLSNPLGAAILSPSHAVGTGTITDDDGTLPVLSIGDVANAEGNAGATPFTFTVSLSAPSSQTVTVNYTTADGGATVADGDYVAASGQLIFAAGETSKTIPVDVNGDTTFEPDETFTVALSGPTEATISPTQGLATGTIQNDDDAAPVVQSIVPFDASPTKAASVSWLVIFSEDVIGVDGGDFIAVADGLTDALISDVSPMSGPSSTYTVTADTGTGSGTLTLRVLDDDSIRDLANIPLGGAGLNNGSLTGARYTIDKTPPDTTITVKPSNPSNSTAPAFQFSSSESLSTFECKLDAGAFAACTSPQTYTGVPDGGHTFQVRAIDFSTNVDPSPVSYSWTVDLVPPDTIITGGPTGAGVVTVTTVRFEFVATEAPSTFACSLNGAAAAPCVSGVTYAGLAGGSYVFRVWATDAAGNVDPTPASRTWSIVANNPGKCRSPWNTRCTP